MRHCHKGTYKSVRKNQRAITLASLWGPHWAVLSKKTVWEAEGWEDSRPQYIAEKTKINQKGFTELITFSPSLECLDR